MNEKIGDKDVALFEESEIISGPSSESVNEKDYLVGEFDASTFPGDNFYDIFDNEE